MIRRSVGLAVVLAATVLAGHPETMLFGLVPVVLWYVGQAALERKGRRALLTRLAAFGAASGLALALTAVQLLPFAEYVSRSTAIGERQVEVFQSPRWAQFVLYPFAHGTPMMEYAGPFDLILEFHHLTVLAIGGVALFLAGIGLVSPRWTTRRAPLFFGAVLVGVTAFLFDLFGLARLVMKLPILSVTIPDRSAIVWSFAIAVLAGFGVDAVRQVPVTHPASQRWAVLAMTGGALAAAGVLAYRAWNFFGHQVFSDAAVEDLARNTLRSHVLFVSLTLVGGVACAVVCTTARRVRIRTTASVGLVVVVLLQGPFMMRGQGVTVPEDRFMNFSPRLERIAERIGDRQTAWVDRARMLPNLNLGIPAYSPDSYDVLGIPTYTHLYEQALGVSGTLVVGGIQSGMLTGVYDPPNVEGLQVMGISRVVTDRGYPFASKSFPGAPSKGVTGDGTAGRFGFRWSGAVPRVLVVYTHGVPDGARLDLVVTGDGIGGPAHLGARVHGALAVATLPAGLAGDGVAFAEARWSDAPGPTTSAEEAIVGARLVSTKVPGLRLLDSIGGYQIFGVPGPSQFLFSPARAVSVSTNAAAVKRVSGRGFDPTAEVVVEADAMPDGSVGSTGSGTVSSVRMAPGRASATVTRADAGYVVFRQNDYPGWKATVNGEDVDVVRANSTFMAVRVPSGTSRVEFRFEPASVRLGAVMSVGAVLICVIALMVAGRQSTERR